MSATTMEATSEREQQQQQQERRNASPPSGEVTRVPMRRPQLRKATTNIRPIQTNDTYGSAFAMSGSKASPHTISLRRAAPTGSPAAPYPPQQPSPFTEAEPAAATTTPLHADPAAKDGAGTGTAAGGDERQPTPAATTTTPTTMSAPKRTATHVPRQIIGRPSTGGQRAARLGEPGGSFSVSPLHSRPAGGWGLDERGSPTGTARSTTAGGLVPVPSQQPMPTARRRGVGLRGSGSAHAASAAASAATTTTTSGGETAATDTAGAPTTGPSPVGSLVGLPAMQGLTRPSEAYRVSLKPSRQQKLITSNARNPRKIVSCFSTKYPLVRRIARELNFEVQETEEDFSAYQFNLCWSDTVLPLTKLVQLGNWQRSNHFPSMYLLSRKGHLGTTLGRLRRHLPTHFAFYPHTWSMRTERVTFQRYYNALRQKRLVKYFIMKPNSGCQGRGIVVTRDPLNAMDDVDNYIVQEYVHRPLLLEQKKFDLRVYILLTSIREPSIFMFNDGLVRVCTENYEPPTDQNAKNACKHLTNYAVNKHSADYVFNTDADHGDVGNKRNFRFLNRWLESEGHSASRFWDEVGFLIVKTILTAQPQIAQVYNSCFPRYNEGYTCFEVLGFDILIDSKMKPWLMEVNHTPSFATDTPLDLDIKGKLLREVWNIVDCKATDQQLDRLREREEFMRRNMPPWVSNHPIYGAPLAQQQQQRSSARGGEDGGGGVEGESAVAASPRASYAVSPAMAVASSEATQFQKLVEARRRNEDSKLMNFARIYPSNDEKKAVVYETIRNLAQKEWSVPDSAAGFTVNGRSYHQPSGFYTASGTQLTPAQQQQQDRIRKDLRDIASGNYTNTTGTGRSAYPPARTSRAAARAAQAQLHGNATALPPVAVVGEAVTGTPLNPSLGTTSTAGTVGMGSTSLTAGPVPSPPTSSPMTASLTSIGSCPTAEAYRRLGDEMRLIRQRQGGAPSSRSSSAPPATSASALTVASDGGRMGSAVVAEPGLPSAVPSTGCAEPLSVPGVVSTAPTHAGEISPGESRSSGLPETAAASRTREPSTAAHASAAAPNGTPAPASPPRSPRRVPSHPPSRRDSKHGTSPEVVRPATPPRVARIEPTPEELARLSQLQQDLDEAEAADPTPASEEESFDLDE